MKNVPDKIIDGINNSWEKGFLIKICLNNETIWWSSRNILIMMNDSEIPVDYGRLALINNGKDISPLSNIKSFMDITMGGGNKSDSGFDITLQNHDGYNQMLNSYSLEGSLVIVYMYYINPTEDIIQLSDAMVVNAGRVNELIYNENNLIYVKCKSSEYFIHKIIPDIRISENDFPFAPKSSYGITLPILYGSFSGTDSKINNFNLAPAICVDENSNKFILAKHEINSNSISAYYLDSKSKNFSEIISDYEYINTENSVSIELPNPIICEQVIQPLFMGSQINSYYNSSFKNGVDKNNNTSVVIQSNHNFYLKFGPIDNFGKVVIYDDDNFGYLKVSFSLGAVTNGLSGKAAKVKYYLDNSFAYLNNYDILASMSGTEVSFLFYFPFDTFYDVLSEIEVGLTTEDGACVELKNVFASFKFNI